MIDWLRDACGFEAQAVHADGDTVHHARLVLGSGILMLGSTQRGRAWGDLITQPRDIGGRTTQSPCVVVTAPNTHNARAKAAGAKIVQDIADQPYGGRGSSCRDPEDHL
jgi:uncharacterized glyoxalase superfamily protein PhnB